MSPNAKRCVRYPIALYRRSIMASEAIPRDVALRIGLAARALPDIESAQLAKVLVEALGLPLSADKLGRLTVRQLQEAADTLFDTTPLPAVKQAMDYLWGKVAIEISDENIPTVHPFHEGDMPGSIRVAIASNNGEQLDGHFGSCARFLVYQLNAEEIRLIAIRPTHTQAELDEDKNSFRARLLEDCHVLCVVSIGGPAAAKVVKQDIHPIKYPNGGVAPEVLTELQQVIASKPPPWLARIMGISKDVRLQFDPQGEEA